jgi:hypothetical protein
LTQPYAPAKLDFVTPFGVRYLTEEEALMRILLGLSAVLLLTAGFAAANTTYSFNTSAVYAGSATVDTTHCASVNDLCMDFGAGTNLAVQLVYTPNTTTNGTAIGFPGTGDNFGFIQAFCISTVDGSTQTTCSSVPLSGDITVTLHETLPLVTSGQFIDVLGGTLGQNSGLGIVNFGTTGFTLGTLTYQMQQPVGGYDINFINANNPTSLQGVVIDTTAPEPATFGIMGAALVALGFVARKRKA